MPAKQFQQYVYTYFPPGDQTPEMLELYYQALHVACHYHIYGIETCPTTAKVHHQGFFWLKNACKMTQFAVRKLLPSAHIEIRGEHATVADNIAYVTKSNTDKPNETVVTFGELPEQGKHQASRLQLVLDCAASQGIGAAARLDASIWARNINAVRIWAQLSQAPRNFKTTVVYLYGPAGCGKSSMALEAGALPMTFDNGFYLGYTNQPVVVLEDIDAECTMKRNAWLTLLDRYPLILNVKGGEAVFNSKVLILTSNFPPALTFNRFWDAAMQRRVEKIFQLPEEKDEAQEYLKTVIPRQEASSVEEEAIRL